MRLGACRVVALFLCKQASDGVVRANHLYLAPDGDDASADGTEGAPFGTVAACASAAGDGGTCYVRGGRYRATEEVLVGLRSVTIEAAPGEVPIFDGTLPIEAAWEEVSDGIYRAAVTNAATVAHAAGATGACESW